LRDNTNSPEKGFAQWPIQRKHAQSGIGAAGVLYRIVENSLHPNTFRKDAICVTVAAVRTEEASKI
jgi:hypothetical protein